jgi:hypothetical protein
MNVIVLKIKDDFSSLEENIIFHNTKDIMDYFNSKGYTVSISTIDDLVEVKLRSEFGMIAEYEGFWAKFVK